eukprot:5912380-Amphidinium_carterae.1
MVLTEPSQKGSLIHGDVAAASIRVTTDGYASEGTHQTAVEDVEPSVVVTQLSSLGIKRMRIRGKSAASSLLGLGAPAVQLPELVHAAKAKAQARPSQRVPVLGVPCGGEPFSVHYLFSVGIAQRCLLGQQRYPTLGTSAPFPVPGQGCAAGSTGDQAYVSSVQSGRRLLGSAQLPRVQPSVMEAVSIPSP